MWTVCALVLSSVLACAVADTPANCTYEEIAGTWTFFESAGGDDNTVDCGDFKSDHEVTVTLTYPDLAKDGAGNSGFWTIIYNQGFEVVVGGRKYFAFSNYTQVSKTVVVSHCSSTLNGWSHKVDGSDWACYYGVKKASSDEGTHFSTSTLREESLDQLFTKNPNFVDAVNRRAKLWKAVHYPEMEGMTLRDLQRRAGGVSRFGRFSYPSPATPTLKTRALTRTLPTAMDWRTMAGKNYVTPIRNQGACGSCYAFASMAMLESRLLILSNYSMHKVFSPQDVVGCSEYAQGCEGGFPYLIAGKYAEDFGVVEEQCFPYIGSDSRCSEKKDCQRYRATDYKYVGGYFGACNEDEMVLALQDGPVSVAFEVTPDFQRYRSGIYHTTGLTDSFNPFRLTNHAVLAVGYGEEGGVKYWIVKNSWGEGWGEEGYFRIRRGTNELNIESMAVIATPVMP